MNAPIITQTGHPLFQFKTVEPRLKRSLWSVVRHRILSWLEKASLRAIGSALVRLATVAAVAAIVFAPHFLLGLLTAAATWNGYRIPAFLTLLALTLYARPALRWLRRTKAKAQRAGNQYTFESLPVGDLASFLKETGAWKHDEAMDRLAISEGQWERVGVALEKNDMLVRGPSNARVLRDIGFTHLVTQLRALAKGATPPLMWDEINNAWTEREDSYGRFLRDQSFRRRKLEEQTERIERRAEKAERRMEAAKQEASTFASIMALPG